MQIGSAFAKNHQDKFIIRAFAKSKQGMVTKRTKIKGKGIGYLLYSCKWIN
jgi:hypothetical protein